MFTKSSYHLYLSYIRILFILRIVFQTSLEVHWHKVSPPLRDGECSARGMCKDPGSFLRKQNDGKDMDPWHSQRNKFTTTRYYIQFSSVAQSYLTLCGPMDCSMSGFPVRHQLPEFAQTHVHWVGDAIQPSHLLSSPYPTFNFSQRQGLFQWVSSSHQGAKVLELQL